MGAIVAAVALALPAFAADQPDAELQRRVEARLSRGELSRNADVRVQVAEGRAVLTGAAITLDASREAERQARKVTGEVENRVRVVPEEDRADDEVARDVAQAILRYPYYTVFDSVEAEIVDGVVALRGSVLQPYRRNDIDRRVARVPGVRAIDNGIAVQSVSIYDARLRQQLVRAIYGDSRFVHYSSWSNPPIRIVVDAGRVTLTGVVSSRLEQVLLTHITRGLPVFSVDNRVEVEGERSPEPAKPDLT
jgi:osmotically-inducible protein OsmY